MCPQRRSGRSAHICLTSYSHNYLNNICPASGAVNCPGHRPKPPSCSPWLSACLLLILRRLELIELNIEAVYELHHRLYHLHRLPCHHLLFPRFLPPASHLPIWTTNFNPHRFPLIIVAKWLLFTAMSTQRRRAASPHSQRASSPQRF
jgi:hypothetical protein